MPPCNIFVYISIIICFIKSSTSLGHFLFYRFYCFVVMVVECGIFVVVAIDNIAFVNTIIFFIIIVIIFIITFIFPSAVAVVLALAQL